VQTVSGVFSLLFVWLTISAEPSTAPPADADVATLAPSAAEMARAKAEEAEQLYQQRDLAGALTRLKEAFALYPSAKIHYNFGLVERALLREVDAIASFERFLAEAPEADGDRRADAARQLAELRAYVVTVQITCDTTGAEAFIDGRTVGTTPIVVPLRVSPGPHQVVVQKDGVPAPFVQRIEAAAGSVVVVNARLAPLVGNMQPVPPHRPDTALAIVAKPPVPAPRPVYRRGWFWGGVGALVSVVGVSAMLMTRTHAAEPICGQRCALGEFPVDAP
jgi:hypothetical protein